MATAALGQSQPGMLTALSAREDAVLALLGVLACLAKASLPSPTLRTAAPTAARTLLDTQGH